MLLVHPIFTSAGGGWSHLLYQYDHNNTPTNSQFDLLNTNVLVSQG